MQFGKIGILGDSYSAYQGSIPAQYEAYYPNEAVPDVTDISQMWWHIVAKKSNSQVVVNSSYSGTCIARTSYEGRVNEKASFTYRLRQDIDLTKIDRLFVLGGTNDCWADSPLGEIKFENITDDDLLCTLPSLSYIFDYVRQVAPSVAITFVVNTDLKEQFVEFAQIICKHYDVDCVVLRDIDKSNRHPSAKGMQQIATQILDFYK